MSGMQNNSEVDSVASDTAIQNVDTETNATNSPALQPANESERVAIQQTQNTKNENSSQS